MMLVKSRSQRGHNARSGGVEAGEDAGEEADDCGDEEAGGCEWPGGAITVATYLARAIEESNIPTLLVSHDQDSINWLAHSTVVMGP